MALTGRTRRLSTLADETYGDIVRPGYFEMLYTVIDRPSTAATHTPEQGPGGIGHLKCMNFLLTKQSSGEH